MYFDLVSRKRFAKASRTTGKAAGGCVYGWLLLMAVLAGQVDAQDCIEDEDNLPLCNLRFDPSANLLLGQPFSVICTFDFEDCESDCYRASYVVDINGVGIVRTEEPNGIMYLSGSPEGLSTSANGCNTTLNYVQGADSENNFIKKFHQTRWRARTESTKVFARRDSDEIITKVQVLRSGIPQESIQTTIVQPLDIVANIIAQASSQQIEGSYRAETMINWPHAESFDAGDGTYYGREYLINGTTGQLLSTPNNSTVITLNSKQVDQGFTLIIKNQLGVGNSTFFQPSWPESAIRLTQQNDGSWLVEVNSTEPVTDLTIEDSRMESIVLSDLDIDTNTDADPINSALTFTANLEDEQSYTLRLDLRNLATTQEIKATTQATMQESQPTLDQNTPNSGISTQALPQLLTTAAIAALAVNLLMSVRTP